MKSTIITTTEGNKRRLNQNNNGITNTKHQKQSTTSKKTQKVERCDIYNNILSHSISFKVILGHDKKRNKKQKINSRQS